MSQQPTGGGAVRRRYRDADHPHERLSRRRLGSGQIDDDSPVLYGSDRAHHPLSALGRPDWTWMREARSENDARGAGRDQDPDGAVSPGNGIPIGVLTGSLLGLETNGRYSHHLVSRRKTG